jgi:uncharacterized membrane protein affecting hemolysin expression
MQSNMAMVLFIVAGVLLVLYLMRRRTRVNKDL